MKMPALFLSTALLATAPLAAQTASTAQPAGDQPAATAGDAGSAAATASAKPNVTVGATVSDSSGGNVGTITQVAGGNATIDTGTTKAAVPVTSFAQGQNGLVLGMTKAQVDAAASQARPTEIAVGSQVVGPQGNPVGKVAAVAGNLVTVETPKTKVQLPKTAFAMNGSNLAIGMTQEQLEAAAAKAGGGQSPS